MAIFLLNHALAANPAITLRLQSTRFAVRVAGSLAVIVRHEVSLHSSGCFRDYWQRLLFDAGRFGGDATGHHDSDA